MEKMVKLKKWCEDNFVYIFFLILLLVWLDIFIFKNINLASADIGRHIKNGEIFLSNSVVAKTNLYSYTNPDYPFVNHHWGSGVIFYLIWKLAGFPGLSFFYIAFALLTFFIFFEISKKSGGLAITIPAALLTIPLIGERTEIRPEIFSYFFSSIFLWILWNYHERKISHRWLFIIPFLEIIWVNFHIYFILGFIFVGAFWLDEMINHSKLIAKFFSREALKGYEKFKKLSLIFFLTITSSILNPYGLIAVVYPFNIFRNYGYKVMENQSVWFLERLGITHDPNYLLYKIVAIFLIISFISLFLINRQRFSLSLFGISLIVCVMAGMAIRNFTLFGLIAFPVISYNIGYSLRRKISLNDLNLKLIAAAAAIGIFSLTFWQNSQKISASSEMSLGLYPGVEKAADFFKTQGIQGPIFNNYDIGGYLIYHLYPQEKVFVDNRPEAYSASFFEDIYIPMQENNDTWKKVDLEYNFNVIFFYTNDVTPWGQNFLVTRIDDSDWAPVFADQYAIIFLKRNEKNRSTIEKYEISRNNFKVTKNE